MLTRRSTRFAVLVGLMWGALGTAHAKDIVQTATDAGQFTMLLKAAEAAGLVKTLSSAGPFTVFAPTDAAFKAVPADTVANLMKPENKDKLAKLLSYHVVTGRFRTKDAAAATPAVELKSLESQALTVKSTDGVLTVNDAKIVKADIEADNGVVQVIDKVLMPPMPVQPTMMKETK